MPTLLKQDWEESERGWGVRPDGYSLHLSAQHLKEFIKAHWDGMSKSAPDEYSRPSGNPYPVEVTDKLFEEVRHAGIGLQVWRYQEKNYENEFVKNDPEFSR